MNDRTGGRTLAIFDLCDTLYATNTTVGFLEYYRSRAAQPAVARALERWLSRRSPFFYYGAIAHRFLRRDIARERLIASLAGESRSALQDAATIYASDVLPALENSRLHGALAGHHGAGDRVIIMSSSLDLVVAPIAALLKVEFEASTLGFEGGRCTGRITRDLTGRKAELVEQYRRHEGGKLMVYTDNHSDKSLIDLADRATVVLPKGKHDGHWAGEGVQYVQL